MNDKIAKNREAAVESSRSFLSKFLREKVLPMMSSFIFNNPQEPNVAKQPNDSQEDASQAKKRN